MRTFFIPMKKIIAVLLSCVTVNVYAQKVSFTPLLEDAVSIRSLQIWDGKVWYSGTDSKFGYVHLNNPSDKKQLKLSAEKLQFRTLAQDHEAFYAINIESPARFFRIDKLTLNSAIIYQDPAENAFYDALHFHKNRLYTFSDPEKDLRLKFAEILIQKGKAEPRYYSSYTLNSGEAAFAASNTNIAARGRYVWLATGGTSSRVFRLNIRKRKIEIFNTPFIQGNPSQGIYSIDFYDKNFGVAVGGDYTKQTENSNNIATTHNGGKTWQIQASGKNGGYKTCVKIRPRSGGKEMIAVGDQNIEYSKDFGRSWATISDEKGLYVCEWTSASTVVLAGKNRIIHMKIE